jgi:hypothetical protein
MKTIAVSVALGSAILCGVLMAAPLVSADKVQFQKGKVLVMQNNALTEAKQEVALPFDILVNTNGAYTVAGGKPRQLQEGEVLDRSGMLLKSDGTLAPVMDHVAMNRGRVVVVRDGDAGEVKDTVKLGDGSTISADAYLTPANGTRRRLLDGEIFFLKGGALPSRDTVSMKDGRVMVQKDGSPLVIQGSRTITMNDGTKVFGDGTVVKFNGETTKLREGETIVLEGVQRRSP